MPLTYLLGEDGIGMFNTSYTLYTFMFAVATSGFPIAVSKMVSESIARDNKKEADKIFYIALFLLGAIGMAGAGLLFLFAKPFAQLLGNERAAQGIMAIAPAVFFVAVMSAFRGYFQGRQNMYPTAISEVIEALGKLVIGYFLAAYLMKNGLKYSSACSVIGVSFCTFLGVVYLLIIFISLKFEGKTIRACNGSSGKRNIYAVPSHQLPYQVLQMADLFDNEQANQQVLPRRHQAHYTVSQAMRFDV